MNYNCVSKEEQFLLTCLKADVGWTSMRTKSQNFALDSKQAEEKQLGPKGKNFSTCGTCVDLQASVACARITTNISKTTKVSSTTKNKWHASSSRPKRKADTATPRLAAPRITVTQPISKKIAREPPHQLLRSYHASNIETHVRTYIVPFMCLCIFVSGCLHVFLEIHTLVHQCVHG